MKEFIGIDTGGTFTDFVVCKDGQLTTHKHLSTPDAPERAIIEGLKDLKTDLSKAPDIAHGTTVATNAVLERKGARVAYITNRGFADTLTIGRQTREALYHLTPVPIEPPVPSTLCLETGGRIAPDGSVVEDLSEDDINTVLEQLDKLDPEAVAINLLFSFVDPRFECALEEAITKRFPNRFFISRSSVILPEYREYERGIATWLNSCAGPVMQSYISRLQLQLQSQVADSRLRIMQSDGCMISTTKVGDYAVRMLLSGPAGGVIAMDNLGKALGYDRLLGFDMGGTSTDVSMIDGDIELTDKGQINRYPIATAITDIHTIGSGGGSIAYLDAGGLLRVGPESAGAYPGPACYGRGGEKATVSDANCVLGRLPERLKSLTLDRQAAERAIKPIAEGLNTSIESAAAGIIDVVNEHMIQALKVMSVHRGKDPQKSLLFGFGAAGGLHVCALADGLDIKEAIVPVHAGVFSALGMLLAPLGINKSHAVCLVADEMTDTDLDARFDSLDEILKKELDDQNITPTRTQHQVDVRYYGQAHCIRLPRTSLAELVKNFNTAYEERYNYALDLPVEIVILRASAEGRAMLDRNEIPTDPRNESDLGEGPQTITVENCTIYIPHAWSGRTDEYNNIRLKRTRD